MSILSGAGHRIRILVTISLILAATGWLVALAGCGSNVATVNGQGIPRGEVSAETARRIAIVRQKNPAELKGDKGEKLEKQTQRQVATELIKATLIEQEARKLKIKLSNAEVSKRIEAERSRIGAGQFKKQLKDQGLTEAGYRRNVEGQVLVEQLGGSVSSGVTVTPDEAESFYLTHKDLFSKGAMIHVAHILLDSEGQAQMVEGELKNGTDFSTLAKSLSRDTASARNGGDIGWIEKGTMDPAFESAAFALGPGEVSGVVKASDGYHVIKVLERRDEYTPPFSEVKDNVMKTLLNRKKDEKFADWLRTVYANAEVKVDSGLGRWDPRLGMVVDQGR